MNILVNKSNYKIIDTVETVEVISDKWIKSSHGSLIQLDTIEIFEVDNVPENAEYYYNNQFTNYNPIEYQIITNQYILKVKELVRQKYKDADSEIAILRKYTAGIDFKNEFEEYNSYVESCKLQAKEETGLI